ncbi:Thiol:disulfide interchange protein DsbE [Paraburkholderia ultramafica]|uniref:Thiol:disulfide interchange protein DsbE n=1 Tax=Paraburkholderia ultramafica TaxID=1544867 RepID=A0A6S7BHU3_9BURK|nr:DsbE family thiol:disulfide interchange protein [Paraburkholderia ultramafica]CAB3800579.1 Thiol:disulfide interchange protein DsbE [Paraburkholderia ultramafica]
MKSLRFLIPLGLFIVLVVFLWRGLRLDPHEVPSPLIGKPAPGFTLTRLDDADKTLRRDEMLGKVWMLNVWASWCVSCRQEHATLLEFSRTKAMPIVGLNYKDTRPQGLEWLNRLGNPYDASVFDHDGRVGIDFGVYGVPETFIIDKQGVIRFKQTGPLTPEVIQTRIRPLLKQLNGTSSGVSHG